MSDKTRTLVDAEGLECDIEVIANNEYGWLSLYGERAELSMSASQAAALRDLLNEHFAAKHALPDDALATLDRELSGNPMGEVNAVVSSVPVAVRTGGKP